MATMDPMEMEKKMTKDTAIRLANKRKVVEQEYIAEYQDLHAQTGGEDGQAEQQAGTNDKQMQSYMKQLAGLISKKREIEKKIVESTDVLLRAMGEFEGELNLVLEGREKDFDTAREKVKSIGLTAENRDVKQEGRVDVGQG